MGKKHVLDGVEVELDDDINPDDVERWGADSRDDQGLDWDAVEAAGADDSKEDDDE